MNHPAVLFRKEGNINPKGVGQAKDSIMDEGTEKMPKGCSGQDV